MNREAGTRIGTTVVLYVAGYGLLRSTRVLIRVSDYLEIWVRGMVAGR